MNTITLKNKPVILKNTDFQTILIQVMFFYKKETNDLANINLLPALLNFMNNKYKTESEFALERKKLMILGTNVNKMSLGENGYYSFNMIVPDTYALGDDLLDEQFAFLKEFIYNPRVENGAFLQFEFEREKENIKRGIDNCLKNMMPYHSHRIKNLIDDEGYLSDTLINNQELLNEATPQSVYEFYLNNIKNNQPVIYVFGNVDENRINDLCNKFLYLNKFENTQKEYKLDYYLKPRDTVQTIEENSTFKDSAISYIYKVKDMNKNDIIVLNLIKDLLNSLSSRLLNKKLRDENDLIYSSKVVSYEHFGVFEITALINKDNVSIVKTKILEVIEDLKNEELVTPLLENIKERKRLNLLRILDDKYALLSEFVVSDLKLDDTLEVLYEKTKNITAKDISNFVNRLVLDTVYFLKEEEYEQN